MATTNPTIGTLRWLVTLATRRQSAPSDQTGILEAYTMLQTVHADIQPIRPMTYWASMQVDTPVTHLIRLRWLNVLDDTQAVVRTTTLRNADTRTEIFRVRRMMEVEGRKRYVHLECELEQVR